MVKVIDTNVWVAAAGGSDQADAACVRECERQLEGLLTADTLAVDDGWQILNEYFRHIPEGTAPRQILSRALRLAGRVQHRACALNTRGQWRLPAGVSRLDASDRKFVAVALTYDPPAPILNAVDSDWAEAREELEACGVRVTELCPNCLRNREAPAEM